MKVRLLDGLSILQFVLSCRAGTDVTSSLAVRDTVPAPIEVAASQDWDGNDGPWSSFAIQVGTPAQNVKVMVATSGWQTMTVLPGGCIESDPSNCASLRGGFFTPASSTTYVKNNANLSTNIYPMEVDKRLGYAGRAAYGFDTVTLGWPGSGGPTLLNQTVGTFVTKDFYLGILGISPRASNFTSFDDPIPSYVENLVNQSKIPSKSWSYTAGNKYRSNGVLGSLILGGYDSSRFVANDVVFPFNERDAIDLTLQIEAITTSDGLTTQKLLPSAIPAMVDSAQPNIWLPLEACVLFEQAFGLTWNETLKMYLLNSTQHEALKSLKPSVTFTLGNLTAGANVDITLPYDAFDLNVSSPIVPTSTYYFPLQRAANNTQYTLGRTFFQEAYVTANYDKGQFFVSQCSWTPAQKQIVPIVSSTNSSSTAAPSSTGEGSSKAGSSSSVPVGAIAGGVGGGVVVLIVAGILLWCFWLKPRRRKRKQAEAVEVDGSQPEAETGGTQPTGTDPPVGGYFKAELATGEVHRAEMEGPMDRWVVEADGTQLYRTIVDGKTFIYEKDVEGHTIVYEMDARERGVWAVEADGTAVPVYEMPAREEVAHEMRGQRDSIEAVPPSGRPNRWSWDTAVDERSEVGSPRPTNTTAVSSPESVTISPESGAEISPQAWRAKLARLPE